MRSSHSWTWLWARGFKFTMDLNPWGRCLRPISSGKPITAATYLHAETSPVFYYNQLAGLFGCYRTISNKISMWIKAWSLFVLNVRQKISIDTSTAKAICSSKIFLYACKLFTVWSGCHSFFLSIVYFISLLRRAIIDSSKSNLSPIQFLIKDFIWCLPVILSWEGKIIYNYNVYTPVWSGLIWCCMILWCLKQKKVISSVIIMIKHMLFQFGSRRCL